MRYMIVLSAMLLGPVLPANAHVSIGIGTPDVSIGINMPGYPEFVRVPSYPVYYAPRVGLNLFFYDGLYWAYHDDSWYASSWYNGPWGLVPPPPYFHGWAKDAPPRWGQRYGKRWEQDRYGWDNWNRYNIAAPAPLPVYQRQYSGDRYPRYEQQPVIRGEYYHYQPSDPVARQQYEQEDARSSKHSHKVSKPGNGQGQGQGNDRGNGKGGGNGQGYDD
jgi:hypothetical protein